ncbi:MAG TPA: TetR/AcrR family transcriptional regulator [Niabella sp.]|nr:TetR/AcrR family transcriptional regulator [Niabella sp.]
MRIFFVEGKLHATTEMIAKEAGVNRGLIHYYFKGRDRLFQAVFTEAMLVVDRGIQELFLSKKISFRKKIGDFVEMFIDQNLKYPYMETFLITEINREGFKFPISMTPDLRKQLLKNIEEDLKKEIKEGNVPKMSAEQFVINTISLCAYPAFAKPLFQQVMGINDAAYRKMILDRKNLIMKVLFRG